MLRFGGSDFLYLKLLFKRYIVSLLNSSPKVSQILHGSSTEFPNRSRGHTCFLGLELFNIIPTRLGRFASPALGFGLVDVAL